MESFKWVWKYIKNYKLRMGGGLLLSLAVSALAMVNPYVSGIIVDKVITGRNFGILPLMIAIIISSTLLKSLARFLYQMNFEFVSQDILFKIRENVYSKLQGLDFSFFDKTKTGDIMSRMTGDLDAVRHFISFVIYMTFENTVTFLLAMVLFFTINVKFALVLLAVTPVIGIIARKMATSVKPVFSQIREQFSKLNSVVQENISGNRVVKAFAKEGYEIDKFEVQNEGYRQKNLDAARIWEKYLPVLDALANMLNVVVILAGGIMVINNTLTFGELVTFNGLIWALNGPMRMAGWLINDVQRFAASAEKVMGILGVEAKIKDSPSPVKKERLIGNVDFRNVSFSYGDEQVLENISFSARSGQTIAIIGPTGSGKSTLVSLICRFYDCTGGEVLIDGINIKEIDIHRLRENVSVAMQDIFLFSDTIEGNIAYGAPDAPMEKVEWAARVAGASDFISSFTDGYDTIIGERGVGLSGGQKQRIALARALLKNPSIIILDDTTSSVDMETEHEIHKTLRQYYKDKTTFIIAHRISSVKNADLILVIEDGKIVEQGRHEALLEKKGYYYSVYRNQLGDFDRTRTMEVI